MLRDIVPAIAWRVRRIIDRDGLLPEIRRLPPTGSDVGLSFDDGPTEETTRALIGLLRDYTATATFFLTGERAATSLNLVAELVDAGHDIFFHGWHHVRYGRLPVDALIRDLDRFEELVSQIRPTPSQYLIRLPYGSGHGDPRLHRAIRQWNPTCVIAHWDYVTRDWELADGCYNDAELRRRCEAAADRAMGDKDIVGSIVLMHEKSYDVDAHLNSLVAPLLVSALLSKLSECGLRGSRITVPSPELKAARR
ncbi:MAG: polysaccharide deacetylase family protein [Acetobacteraceae bacterium]